MRKRMISTAGWQVQGVPVRYRCRNNFQRKDFVRYQWSKTRERRIHHPPTGANSGADHLLSGFSGLGNSAHKGDDRDGGSLRFLNPCCDQVLFAVAVPTVVDRFVQQAVAQVLTPIFEEQFHDHSYGFRPNRCAQQAVLKALEMMNDGHSWIVDIDLAKFFDTVDHDKLMTIIGRTIKDGDVISVVRKFLVSGVMIDDEYEDTIVGTPQGGLCRARHKEPYDEINVMSSCH